jgi:lysophospholipase L1-like esterase
MFMNCRIPTLAHLFVSIFVAALPVAAQGADSPSTQPLLQGQTSLRFVGRWDRREPERAITVNSGSYLLAQFDATSISARFDVSGNRLPLPTITWRIDQGDWQEAEVAPIVQLAQGLKPLASSDPAGHTLTLMARGLDEHQSRWSPPLVACLTFNGLELSEGGKLLEPLPEWDKPKLKMEILGDSITEGVLVHAEREGKKTWPWRTDGRLAYSCQTAFQLGAQCRQVGFGAQGLTHGGSGGSAAAPDAFNFFYKSCPRDDWQADLVVINQGTNDGGAKTEKFRPLYRKLLDEIREAYPKAKIAAMRPFNGAHAADIAAEVKASNDAGDSNVFYIDTTGWLGKGDFTDGLHPNVEGSGKAADKLTAALKEHL